jgi:DNA-binding response OmpR family regulator
MKVLLAEDDAMIGENIQIGLESEAISVDWVTDGVTAEASLGTKQYDAMILDLALPKKDGIDVIRSVRAKRNSVPILVVSARDGVSERVLGLSSGADDYLVKPFDLKELSARVHALVRRSRGRVERAYKSGNVTVIALTRQVFVEERQVKLSSREWAILDALMLRPGAILSRADLEERLYGWSGEVESNAVEVYIHGLRKKLGQQFVVNVRGMGYIIEKDTCARSEPG